MTNHADTASIPGPAPDATAENGGSATRRRKPQAFVTAVSVIGKAREELQHLTGYKVDSVSGFEKTDDGWRLSVTVVELRRIPAATDVLATYEVILDGAGDIVTYHRGNRYFRDQVGQDQ